MQKVQRNELLSLADYEQVRPHFRGRMIEAKRRRRVILGDHMSLVFENHDSVMLQVQEMLRAERISDEPAIAHELETYNELVPGPGQLSATLFIEYDDKQERERMLCRFASLRSELKLRIGDDVFPARFGTHFGEEPDRIPAVNYLVFEVGNNQAARLRDANLPARLEVTHPDYPVAVDLTSEQRAELAGDLTSDS